MRITRVIYVTVDTDRGDEDDAEQVLEGLIGTIVTTPATSGSTGGIRAWVRYKGKKYTAEDFL